MAKLRTWWRRLRSIAWTALTLVVLLAAILVGLGKLLMPYSTQFKPRLEAWLSEEFNQPVRVESFTGEWKAFGPRISLREMELLGAPDAGGGVALREAGLDIRPLNAFWPGRPLYTFRIIGADLVLSRNAEGRFELSGLGVSGRGGAGESGGLGNLARLGEVMLESSSLAYRDPARDIALQLVNVDGRMQMSAERLALEVRAGVADASRDDVLGDIGATAVVNLDDDDRVTAIRWHVESGEFLLSELTQGLPEHDLIPDSGRLNAQVWGDWAPGQPQRMTGVLDIRDGVLASGEELLRLDHVNSRFRWRFTDRYQWRLDLADVQVSEGGREWTAGELAVERNLPGGLGIWVGADYLLAPFPLALTQRIMANFNAHWPRNMPTTATAGEINAFDIVINADKKFVGAWGEFHDLAVLEWGRWPAVDGLNGTAALAYGQGGVDFSGQDVIVNWPRNFRAPAILDIPACHMDITWGERWQVDVNACRGGNEHANLETRLKFVQSEGKPYVDLAVATDHLDLPALADFWPSSLMKPPVREWLARSIRAGTVEEGRFLLRGDMDQFPFPDHEGILDATAVLSGATLAFHEDWPEAEGIDAALRFRGQGMTMSGSIADLGGVPVRQAGATIRDFRRARLDIDYEGRTPLPALAAFLRQTPLLDNTDLDIEQFTFEGPASVNGRVRLPLGSTPGALDLSGQLVLEGNHFSESQSGVRLENIAGRVAYDRSGFSAEDLSTTWQAWPARLDLAADWTGGQPFSATLDGRFPVAELVAATPMAGDAMLSRLQGEAYWQVRFDAVASETGGNDLWLDVRSDLLGVDMDLPAPLAKAAGVARPFTLRYPLKATAPLVEVSMTDVGALSAALTPEGEQIERAAIRFSDTNAMLPGRGEVKIDGRVDRLDMDGWLELVTDYAREGIRAIPLRATRGELAVDELVFMNRAFDQVSLVTDQPEDAIELRVDGEAMAGDLRYHTTAEGAHSLSAQMERVHMPRPLSDGMTMDSDPTRLPEFHLYVQDLRYHGLVVGETRIEAYPVADGLRIESVEAESEHMTFQARGDWVSTGVGSRSDFDILLTAENLGDLISAMALSEVLEGGQTMIHYNAWWPGPPAAFELAHLNGTMDFSITDGRVLDANPGAGRVLGLFSVAALPRRLALDFRDVFESGFNFDQAGATVNLESGVARTDDFTMESTAATLAIEGEADLVNQRFDYRMTVRPGVSQALPVIGALAAGPPGAAAGLALQGLLRDALGDATEARYNIVGPWSDPEVTRQQAPQAVAETPGAEDPPGP